MCAGHARQGTHDNHQCQAPRGAGRFPAGTVSRRPRLGPPRRPRQQPGWCPSLAVLLAAWQNFVRRVAAPLKLGVAAPPKLGVAAPLLVVGVAAPRAVVGLVVPPPAVGTAAPPLGVGVAAPPLVVGTAAPPRTLGTAAPPLMMVVVAALLSEVVQAEPPIVVLAAGLSPLAAAPKSTTLWTPSPTATAALLSWGTAGDALLGHGTAPAYSVGASPRFWGWPTRSGSGGCHRGRVAVGRRRCCRRRRRRRRRRHGC